MKTIRKYFKKYAPIKCTVCKSEDIQLHLPNYDEQYGNVIRVMNCNECGQKLGVLTTGKWKENKWYGEYWDKEYKREFKKTLKMLKTAKRFIDAMDSNEFEQEININSTYRRMRYPSPT